MAYCPKCGVSVEGDDRPCPLCHFHIPKVSNDEDVIERKFPQATNPYPDHFRRVLNRIFIFISLLIFVAISLMFYINYELEGTFTWSRYSNLSVLAGWGVLYFSFGYIQNFYKIIIGIAVISLIYLSSLDALNGELEWFFPLAFPIVVGTAFIGLCYYSLVRSLTVRGFNIIGFFFIAVLLLSMWINFFISSHEGELNIFRWLLVTGLQIIPVLLIMVYIKYGLPERIKKTIERKFHL